MQTHFQRWQEDRTHEKDVYVITYHLTETSKRVY